MVYNFLEVILWKNKVVFVGFYYLIKKECCVDFDVLINVLKKVNVDCDIFDRCFYWKELNLKFFEWYK